MPKINPQDLNALSLQIKNACLANDWQALKACDLHVRELLGQHKSMLESAPFTQALNTLKHTHQQAFIALSQARDLLDKQIHTLHDTHERAKEYEITMEWT